MKERLKQYGLGGEAVFALGVIAILMLLFVPVSKLLLDVLIILNISLALLVLLLTFYSNRPLDFSTFPSVLLLATLFRLGLNISSTRLILADGDAGKMISSVGSYVVAGNYIIGMVIFFILVVVQFVVVTNGAQRVAEVAARFTLDSMPGKQMSIDADLNMGIINEKEAQSRRTYIEKEANFYGAMDGATKFVKGDAIAGIIIILINIIGGLAIGVAQAGLSWQEALQLYTLLTVGDGIVTQIPSLIIAVGTGIIITRAATQGNLADQLFTQVVTHPFTLVLVALVLISATFIPGLPSFSLVLVSMLFALVGYVAYRRKKSHEETPSEKDDIEDDSQGSDLLRLVLKPELSQELRQDKDIIYAQFNEFKTSFESKYGLILPKLQIAEDHELLENEYSIRVFGVELASGQLYPNSQMVIDPSRRLDTSIGIKATEPAYGLPALWVGAEDAKASIKQGMTVVDSNTVLSTHLNEFVKRHADEFVTREVVDQIIKEQKERNEVLVTEVLPAQLSIPDLHQILTNLIQEKVAIHNANHIFEVLADKARNDKDIDVLTEWVRNKLRNQIVNLLTDKTRTLNIISIAPNVERNLLAGAPAQTGQALRMSPVELENLVKQLSGFTEKAISMQVEPVLLVSPTIRRAIWKSLNRTLPLLHVISTNEVPSHIKLNSLGVVQEQNLQVA